jgi:hypothetical protein
VRGLFVVPAAGPILYKNLYTGLYNCLYKPVCPKPLVALDFESG